ncbi:MAG: hypothetical protein AUK17_01325 [Parcubacteria group bacterium CG2_30_44_18]|nr:MAG: hypothetical protein AUK17_01325 [Parcubacteria group bacterium CG2_30_44_18]
MTNFILYVILLDKYVENQSYWRNEIIIQRREREMKEKKEQKQNPVVWVALAVLAGMFFWQLVAGPKPINLATSDFEAWLKESGRAQQIELITVKNNSSGFLVVAKIKNQKESVCSGMTEKQADDLKNWADREKVKFSVNVDEQAWWVSLLPWFILGGIWLFFIYMRKVQGGAGGMGGLNSFAKSQPRTEIPTTRFSDVAGIDEAILEVGEVVDFLKTPARFIKVGAKIPKGVLLVGPPGTGKTLLARAVAGEAGVPFFSISGSEFVEMFVGVGAGRVRSLFEQAKKSTPCIVFIDEIDAMGHSRGAGIGQSYDEGGQTLNQLFTEMDGFDVNQGIIVLAATNRPDVLDVALMRPGRFDRHVEVGLPDVRGREQILRIHTRNKPLADNVSLSEIARGTASFSGAQLEQLANEAAMLAAREGKSLVDIDHFRRAQSRILMGEERHIIVSDADRKLTAYHEAGHAIVGAFVAATSGGDAVHQVTIIPRRSAMGVTGFLPKEDKYTYAKAYCMGKIKTLLGGRVAEELTAGIEMVTTGAGLDLKTMTNLVRRMVCDWGMSDKLPLRTYGEHSEQVFLGRDLGRERDYGEDMAKKIDDEIDRIIAECLDEVRLILTGSRDKLELLANALLERETLSGDEVRAIVGGEAESEAQAVLPILPTETKAGKKDWVLRWLKYGWRNLLDLFKWAKGKLACLLQSSQMRTLC